MKKIHSMMLVVLLLFSLLSVGSQKLEGGAGEYGLCLGAAYAAAMNDCSGAPLMVYNNCVSSWYQYYSGFCLVFLMI